MRLLTVLTLLSVGAVSILAVSVSPLISEERATHVTSNNKGTCEEFQCDNGNCLPRQYVCDHHTDCGGDDISDERNCTYSCAPGEFQCPNDGHCIPGSWVCDGTRDCIHGEDEQNCKNTISETNMTQTTEENNVEAVSISRFLLDYWAQLALLIALIVAVAALCVAACFIVSNRRSKQKHGDISNSPSANSLLYSSYGGSRDDGASKPLIL